jgi:hypothetical protein
MEIDNIKIPKFIKSVWFQRLCDIMLIILLITLSYQLYISKDIPRYNIYVQNDMSGKTCISQYNYEVDRLCWYYDLYNREYNIEVIDYEKENNAYPFR